MVASLARLDDRTGYFQSANVSLYLSFRNLKQDGQFGRMQWFLAEQLENPQASDRSGVSGGQRNARGHD